jgi:hypothetical protein
MLGDGRYVANGNLQTRDAAGYRLHLVHNARISLSFGAMEPSIRRDQPAFHDRAMAQAMDDHIWVAHRGRYILEKWNTAGELVSEVHRNVDWFPASPVTSVISETEPPPTRIRVIHEDETGRVWVVMSLADQRWKRAVQRRGSIQNALAVSQASDPNLYHDTVIEVLDVEAQVCHASAQFDDWVHDFLDDGTFITYSLDHNGAPSLLVIRPTIRAQ